MLAENAGATAAPSEPCVVGQSGAQKSPGDVDAAGQRPDSEKDDVTMC